MCYSCNKTKNKLNLKRSSLLPINLFLCQTCIDQKMEPRWVVLISGRQNGHEDAEHVKENEGTRERSSKFGSGIVVNYWLLAHRLGHSGHHGALLKSRAVTQ